MITASRSPSLDIDAVEKRKRKYLLKDRQIDREKKRIKRRRREKRKILIEVFFFICVRRFLLVPAEAGAHAGEPELLHHVRMSVVDVNILEEDRGYILCISLSV